MVDIALEYNHFLSEYNHLYFLVGDHEFIDRGLELNVRLFSDCVIQRDNSKENLKPPQPVEVASSATVNEVMNEELRDIINSHNRRIWAAQNSTYDLNGRRVRKGRTTVVAPVTKVHNPLSEMRFRYSNMTNRVIQIRAYGSKDLP